MSDQATCNSEQTTCNNVYGICNTDYIFVMTKQQDTVTDETRLELNIVEPEASHPLGERRKDIKDAQYAMYQADKLTLNKIYNKETGDEQGEITDSVSGVVYRVGETCNNMHYFVSEKAATFWDLPKSYTGQCARWHSNGQVREKGYLKDGKKEGKWQVYASEGYLYADCHYVGGKECGEFTFYKPDGKPYLQYGMIEYVKHGAERFWHPDSNQLRTEKNYANGEKHGLSMEWYLSGNIKRRSNYVNGKEDGKSISRYDNADNTIKLESTYIDGKQEGKAYARFPDGSRRAEYNYVDGELEGPAYMWHPNGNMKVQYNFRNDAINGQITMWYSDGQKKSQCNFVNNEPVGKGMYWLPNGEEDPNGILDISSESSTDSV